MVFFDIFFRFGKMALKAVRIKSNLARKNVRGANNSVYSIFLRLIQHLKSFLTGFSAVIHSPDDMAMHICEHYSTLVYRCSSTHCTAALSSMWNSTKPSSPMV